MIRTEPIVGVKDVKRASLWYQNLLGCKSLHGGPSFEMLADQDNTVVLCLHKWEEHDHPTLGNPSNPVGNGLILYFRVDNLDHIWEKVKVLKLTLEEGLHLNQNSGKMEFALRDLDNYYLLISE